MAARKLQQEIDKTFKKVAEGIQVFESIFEKIQQTSNASQKEKLEDALKREIKKLQRHRDQIKTWAAGNEIKDKKPLLEQRKAIENEMEKFKAVEKEMKTKAFSKEGLNASAKLDPKEKEKLETCDFLSNMVEELDRQLETLEAEEEALQATVKKGKKDSGKADRLSEIKETTERHKFHQGKLELLLRSLQNGNLETEQVQELEESIKYYVEENQSVEFMEDDTIYDDLNLEEDEGAFGMSTEPERGGSHDVHSAQDDHAPEMTEVKTSSATFGKPKSTSISEASANVASTRRPSNAHKSPLPALATLHTPLASAPNTNVPASMKPAPPPTRPSGETLKYSSAAAAAAATAPPERSSVGIAPLPPPPGINAPAAAQASNAAPTTTTQTPPIQVGGNLPPSVPALPPKPPTVLEKKIKDSESDDTQRITPDSSIHPAPRGSPTDRKAKPVSRSPSLTHRDKESSLSTTQTPAPTSRQANESLAAAYSASKDSRKTSRAVQNQAPFAKVNGQPKSQTTEQEHIEPVYHLPAGLEDLEQSFEITKARNLGPDSPAVHRILQHSASTQPSHLDAERPQFYRPDTRFSTPDYYPQEPFAIAEDPALYTKIDTDTLFYIFYYRQNTYQQYLAAKSLKAQSWRFHKQYQTWFQRHEEPKTITEEFEQGTYRFFDYESTWMNRRKADFRFQYKFLEDDL